MSVKRVHINIGPWLPSHTLCGTTADTAHLVSYQTGLKQIHTPEVAKLCKNCLRELNTPYTECIKGGCTHASNKL